MGHSRGDAVRGAAETASELGDGLAVGGFLSAVARLAFVFDAGPVSFAAAADRAARGISGRACKRPTSDWRGIRTSRIPKSDLHAQEAVKLAEKLGYMPILGGNDVELIAETEDFIDKLVADIDAARHHVHLLFYIFADDGTGRRVAEALARAVKRGVKCRVLVDAVGSRPMFKRLARQMIAQGIEVHQALPVGLFRRRMARIDLRNHRKLAVIDGCVGYTGSQNIVDAGYGRKDLAWYDLMVRLTGPILLELQSVFVADWYFETEEILEGGEYFPESAAARAKSPCRRCPAGRLTPRKTISGSWWRPSTRPNAG